MKNKAIKDEKTGLYLSPGEEGDVLPTWVESIKDAWVSDNLSTWMVVAYDLMRKGYSVTGVHR